MKSFGKMYTLKRRKGWIVPYIDIGTSLKFYFHVSGKPFFTKPNCFRVALLKVASKSSFNIQTWHRFKTRTNIYLVLGKFLKFTCEEKLNSRCLNSHVFPTHETFNFLSRSKFHSCNLRLKIWIFQKVSSVLKRV